MNDALCLGKLPARTNSVKLKLSTYLDVGYVLPKIPKEFGHEEDMPVPWGMLGNDRVGDCLAEGTLVSAKSKTGLKARYSGLMVTISLASGKRLTITPNHALLTTKGFSIAKVVKNGDYLVGTRGAQVLPWSAIRGAEGHVNDFPAPVEKILSSLLRSGAAARVVMPRAVDFHGDEKFIDGNVDIIGSNSFLRSELDPALRQPNTQNEIGTTRQLKRHLVGLGALGQAARRMLFAAYGNVCSGNYGLSFSFAHTGIPQSKRLGLGTQYLSGINNFFLQMPIRNSELFRYGEHGGTRDIFTNGSRYVPIELLAEKSLGLDNRSWPAAGRAKPSSDGFLTDPKLFSDLQRCFPGRVEADRVVNIDIQRCVGAHIYDLSTDCRWYVANGIIAHNCVLAGGAHEHMLWARMGGKSLSFNTADVLRDFTAVTGLPPSPTTGADMQQAAAYRLKTGLLGADGQRHRISAYLALRRGDLRELYAAMYLFGCVGIGIAISTKQESQFQNHQAWAIAGGFPLGLHYVPCVALRSNIVVVTWGRFQAMRPSFYVSESDEAIVYLSDEALTGGRSLEGFDRSALLTDMRLIAQGAVA